MPLPPTAASLDVIITDWEQRALPPPTPAYAQARQALRQQLTGLRQLTVPTASINVAVDDARTALHQATSLRAGYATANGPNRATIATKAAVAACRAHLLGPTPTRLPSVALLSVVGREVLDTADLLAATEYVQQVFGAEIEILFDYAQWTDLAEGLGVGVVVGCE